MEFYTLIGVARDGDHRFDPRLNGPLEHCLGVMFKLLTVKVNAHIE
jgi:hypothetical protein